MILAIDIGGTKTLVSLADENRKVLQSEKFPTPKNYKQFISELSKVVANFSTKYSLVVVAAPGKIDRNAGKGIIFGNLAWKNVPLAKDISVVTKSTVLVENDANLAGLGEAHNLRPVPHKILYITISTGIGVGIITDGVIDPDFADSEAGKMLFVYEGKLAEWESFASGRAIVARYGKMAAEINDAKTWDDITKNFAIGIVDLLTILNPDIVIIGGSVGSHFKKYGHLLEKNVSKMASKMVDVPPIVQAKYPEEAVIHGCLELARNYN